MVIQNMCLIGTKKNSPYVNNMHTNKQLVNSPYAKVLLGSAGRVKMYTHQSPNEKNKGVLIKIHHLTGTYVSS